MNPAAPVTKARMISKARPAGGAELSPSPPPAIETSLKREHGEMPIGLTHHFPYPSRDDAA